MLKKTIIAAALASAAMLAFAGGANAGNGHGFHAPAAKHAGTIAPKTFKLAGKRKFRHGHHFHHWDNWHYRPHRGCYWLKRKARWSGKRYWWKRYYRCRANYYY